MIDSSANFAEATFLYVFVWSPNVSYISMYFSPKNDDKEIPNGRKLLGLNL